ncbi:dipeptide ABC transporter ATP-binding protein [Microtetraspora malaysiensis]|uniref:dipeptide ABC transporter ATP-binding protein n=1 Tax=Microtetraspora malaysiensis TaxID=161358 RepID=UPI00082E6B10|nr:ABC transporter ATP-binding protein [Microtetraspora malaysiensis]
MTHDEAKSLLRIRDLSVRIPTARGAIWPLDGVDLDLGAGETLGLVGESGSGKSMLVRSIMGVTPAASTLSGELTFDSVDLAGGRTEQARGVWGKRVAMVFQDSMTSLNPVVRIGRQVSEGARRHLGLTAAQARERTLDLLDLVGIPDPRARLAQYPHQLSGGMRQRVAIAMALACDPDLLIADEATTALDVTIQRQILDLLQEIQATRRMAMIIVSHDLGVVASRTDRIAVMYGGRIAEESATGTLFAEARHRYTRALLGALPTLDMPRHSVLPTVPGSAPDPVGRPRACRFAPRCPAAVDRCRTERPRLLSQGDSGHRFACFVPVEPDAAPASAHAAAVAAPPAATAAAGQPPRLEVRDLVCRYRVPGGTIHAVSGISFAMPPGETLGVVGESGCGKSSAAKAIVRLQQAASGSVLLDGTDLLTLSPREMRRRRTRIQIVLQDPIASLNPRKTVRGCVAEGLLIQGVRGAELAAKVDDALRGVGVDPDIHGGKKAYQLSGGQAQRVAIARAMALDPDVLVCDEPVSALDVSVQAQVLNLLERLKAERGLTMLFVSHDLSVVRNISDRVAVMYLGTIVELGDADQVYSAPAHPYTRALIGAVPVPDPTRDHASTPRLEGQLPSPLSPPSGCRFRTRCPIARQECADNEPPLVEVAPGRLAACHFPLTGSAEPTAPSPRARVRQ